MKAGIDTLARRYTEARTKGKFREFMVNDVPMLFEIARLQQERITLLEERLRDLGAMPDG